MALCIPTTSLGRSYTLPLTSDLVGELGLYLPMNLVLLLVFRDGCALAATMFPLVPLQIMNACIRQVLDTRRFVSPLATADIDPLPDVIANDATWLPGIGRFLPHSWIPVSVTTDKAVKHHDAAVHTAMWDNRITLLYSWSLDPGLFSCWIASVGDSCCAIVPG
jgi:hypothetical protein